MITSGGTIAVQLAVEQDTPALTAAYRAARSQAFGDYGARVALPRTKEQDEARWRQCARDDAAILLSGTVRGEIAGLALVELSAPVPELGALYVEPSRQRLGLGRALLGAARAHAAARGSEQMTAWVLAANRSAKRLFLDNGGWLDGAVEIRELGGQRLVMQRVRFLTAPSLKPDDRSRS
jgi:GNAT superfamily N-acetyltransferase